MTSSILLIKTLKGEFDDLHRIFLDIIINNLVSLIQTGKYGAINKNYIKTTGYCVFDHLFDTLTLQEDSNTNVQVFKAGEIAVKYQYLRSMKDKSIWY